MGNVGFGFAIFFDILLVLVIAVVVIGTSVANHMRKVRSDTETVYQSNKTKLKDQEKAIDDKLNAKTAEEKALAEARAKELKELNTALNEEQVKAELKAREEVVAEQIKSTNNEVIVAPAKTKEKYTFDPQFKLDYFNGDGTRAYNDTDIDERKFREKFEALMVDGVQF